MNKAPLCRCGKLAITTIAHKPACQGCYDKYVIEARQYLPMVEREFYHQFIYRDWLIVKTDNGGGKGAR